MINSNHSSTLFKLTLLAFFLLIVAMLVSLVNQPVSAQTAPCQGAAFNPNGTYVADDIVFLNDVNYKAKWWTQGRPPGDAWETMGACQGPTATPTPTPTLTPTPMPVSNGYDGVRIFYYIEWGVYGRNFFVNDLQKYVDGGYVTDIQYAFIDVDENGSCQLFDEWAAIEKAGRGAYRQKGNLAQLAALRDANPGIKITMSLGGWTLSDHFSNVAKDDTKLANMVSTCVQMMKQYRFDGLDIDWEYPGGGGHPDNAVDPVNDGPNFTKMLQALRDGLDAEGNAPYGGKYLLTAALPAGEDKFQRLEMTNIGQLLDYASLMTYDFNGAWQEMPAHLTALYMNEDDPRFGTGGTGERYYTDHAIQMYLHGGISADGTVIDGGVPPQKLVMGLPFYGLSWSGVSDTEISPGLPGLYTNADSGWGNMMGPMWDGNKSPGPLLDPTGENSGGSWQKGVWDYDDIANRLLDNGYTRYFDEDAVAVYAYNPDISGGTLISYDDPQSVEIKSKYVADNCLGGIMVWEFTNNSEQGSRDLHDAIMAGFATGANPATNSACDPSSPQAQVTPTMTPTIDPTVEPTATPTPGSDIPLAVDVASSGTTHDAYISLFAAVVLMIGVTAVIGRATLRHD